MSNALNPAFFTPSTPPLMTPPGDPVMAVPPASQDPFDWNVDEVVANLCGRSHPLLTSLDPRSLPEPSYLETALRENGVSGPTLLLELDHASLRDDLGIKALGPRGTIVQLIRKLRRQSQKYIDHIYEEAVDTPLPGYSRVSGTDQQIRPGSSYYGTPPQYAPRAMSITSGILRSPTVMDGLFQHPLPPSHAAEDSSPLGVGRRHEEAQNAFHEACNLPHPESRIMRSADMGGENTTSNSASMALALPENSKHSKSPEAIGFGAKEEAIFDDFTIFTRSTLDAETSNRQGETLVVDASGRKRRKLVLCPGEPAKPPVNDEQATSRTGEHDAGPSHDEASTNPETLVTTEFGNVEQVSTAQDPGQPEVANPLEFDGSEELEGSQRSSQIDKTLTDAVEVMPLPGALIVDSQGRKRMRPVLISQSELVVPNLDAKSSDQISHHVSGTDVIEPSASSDTFSDKLSNQNRKPATRRPADVYLGLEPIPVDKIFYGDTAMGQELGNNLCYDDALYSDGQEGSDTFTLHRVSQKSDGQRHYINARMKYFLRSREVVLPSQKGEDSVGIVPYPQKFARLHQRLSMTLFTSLKGTITVSRADRSRWLKDDLSHTTIPGSPHVNPMDRAFALRDLSLANHGEITENWDYLEKWKYAGDDQVLPAYGDSGSDGEYDMDTWLEMEKEKGTLERPLGQRRRERLSDNLIPEIIDEILEQMIRDWHAKDEPRLQPKAWRLWTKSMRDGNKQEQIERIDDDIEKLDHRLIKLRGRIADEEWAAKKELVQQCKILQPSVFDRELCKWKRAILSLESAPEKPLFPEKRSKSIQAQSAKASPGEDEEDLLTEAGDAESLESDLESFIVEDNAEESPLTDNGTTILDIGDDTLLPDNEDSLGPILSLKPKAGSDTRLTGGTGGPYVKVALPKPLSQQFPDIIDLTHQSDTDEFDVPVPKVELASAIRTPPLYPSDDDPFIRSRRKKPEFKLPPITDSVIDLVSDPVYITAEEDSPSPILLPDLKDVDGIRKFDPRILVERGDRKRLLLYHISRTPALERDLVFIHLQEVSKTELETAIRAGLKAMKSHSHRIRGVDKGDSDVIMRIAGWWVCWTIPVIVRSRGLKMQDIDTALTDKEGFHHFYDFLTTCPEIFEKQSVPEIVSLELEGPTPVKKRQKLDLECSDQGLQNTPNKKRKFALPESQMTLDLRASAQQRVQDRDRRQRELKHRFKNMYANEDPSKVIVNTGKFDHQDFIYLNPSIGDRIQPHQIEGVQFMWREITTDTENLQGCLLAQTMGLGKTMQVITLLVTIAEASRSSNENIRNQIPLELCKSQTLILCPPALIENWWEEFLMWTPTAKGKNVGAVGEIRKVTTTLRSSERLWEIKAWMDEGGVLLMGFNTFRAYIDNKLRKPHGDRTLTEAQHDMVKEALLVRPAIVVADEAHAMKNASTGINAAMSRIKTKSRIALTGSPLMNNLGEYYSLIDWIAPNFLGTRPEFRANFEEPIHEGLYQDSTDSQYRWAMKKLMALKTDLDPKTHRADISVLKGRLKEKQEFVIRVPLTELQKQSYQIYVDCMLSASKENEPSVTTLWAWLATLRLLCNHPKCFRDRLLAREKAGKKTTALTGKEDKLSHPRMSKGELGPLDEDAALLDEPVSAIGITKTMIQRQLNPFDTLTEPLESIALAYKMQILMEILDFSRQAQDKVLVFSHSIPTLDFVENILGKSGRSLTRIDGSVNPGSRQQLTKDFNRGVTEVFLISTRSGGQGLNMIGANRVVILDDNFNPMYEEQAVGRAYRLGQTKPVFVYYLTVAGTFEDSIKNQSLFKQQLAKRVVDSKNPIRRATKGVGEYLFPPRAVEQEDLGGFFGKDPLVLDRVLEKHKRNPIIRSMDLTETFHQEDEMKLTDEEKKEAEQMQKDEQLRRRNPAAYTAMLVARREEEWRAMRVNTAQTSPWFATPTSRPFSSQATPTNPVGAVHNALLHDAPPSTAPPMAKALPISVSTAIPTDCHTPDIDFPWQAQPSASVPLEKHKTVGEKSHRGASEPSENRTAPLSSPSKPKPSLDSRLNSMASPEFVAKNPESFKGQDCMSTEDKTETDQEMLMVEEQGSVDGTTVSLKRKREVDTMSSSAPPGPVMTMFDRLLRREARRSPNG